jgi:hypothetical protein
MSTNVSNLKELRVVTDRMGVVWNGDGYEFAGTKADKTSELHGCKAERVTPTGGIAIAGAVSVHPTGAGAEPVVPALTLLNPSIPGPLNGAVLTASAGSASCEHEQPLQHCPLVSDSDRRAA